MSESYLCIFSRMMFDALDSKNVIVVNTFYINNSNLKKYYYYFLAEI